MIKFKDIVIGWIIGFIIGIIIDIFWYNNHSKEEINTPTPVEKNVIDTLYITRDNIITRVKYLDSIKYDTIEKVYVLNDTASIDLFYKLVSE